jgi:hypothetical protein
MSISWTHWRLIKEDNRFIEQIRRDQQIGAIDEDGLVDMGGIDLDESYIIQTKGIKNGKTVISKPFNSVDVLSDVFEIVGPMNNGKIIQLYGLDMHSKVFPVIKMTVENRKSTEDFESFVEIRDNMEKNWNNNLERARFS